MSSRNNKFNKKLSFEENNYDIRKIKLYALKLDKIEKYVLKNYNKDSFSID